MKDGWVAFFNQLINWSQSGKEAEAISRGFERTGWINKNWMMMMMTAFKVHLSVTRLPCQLRQWSICLLCRRPVLDPWVGKILWRRKWHPVPVLLPGKSHGGRSPGDYSPWGHKDWNTTEWLHFHFPFMPTLCDVFRGNKNSGSLWWTGRPGVLRFMGCRESDTTERLNWTDWRLRKLK